MKYKFIGLILLFPISVFADDYSVTVTREDSNIYKVSSSEIIINTRYCYEYVYYEDSVLRLNGYSSELLFLDSDASCDVSAVYEQVSQASGDYSVTVSHEDDDWYEVWGQNLYIRTSLCLSLALGEEAVLSLQSGGFGTLYLENDQCSVEGIYSKLNM